VIDLVHSEESACEVSRRCRRSGKTQQKGKRERGEQTKANNASGNFCSYYISRILSTKGGGKAVLEKGTLRKNPTGGEG